MNTPRKIRNCLILSTVVLAIAAMAYLTGSASAEDMKPMKGGEHLMMLNKVTTVQQAESLQTNNTMAMVCGKCQTVYITRVKQGTKGAQLLMANGQTTEMIGTHTCPGCGGTWTTTGVGKGATTELKHTCSMCGDNSAFCCATATNAPPTSGMETK